MAPIRCLILAGCTAVGKSSLAMTIARQRPVEIISADSVAVYRGLDLGSAKPSRLCRRQVPHHLVDIADPSRSLSAPYTAGQFARDAYQTIREVAGRGRLPIVCGGSGMYLDFLLHGYHRLSSYLSHPTPSLSDLIDRAFDSSNTIMTWHSSLRLIAHQLDLNLDDLERVPVGNRRRLLGTVQRLRQGQHGGDARCGPPDDIDFRPVVLVRPRLRLYRAIDLRCERMVQHGLLDEVAALARAGQLPPGSPPALAVGYRQALAYLDAWRRGPSPGQFDLGGFRRFLDSFQTASRQLARRQLTWFRQDPVWRWVDAESVTVDQLLGQCDGARDAWDTALATEATSSRSAQLRYLSDMDREQQRRYVPESVIFRPGLDSDVVLRLMASDMNSDKGLTMI